MDNQLSLLHYRLNQCTGIKQFTTVVLEQIKQMGFDGFFITGFSQVCDELRYISNYEQPQLVKMAELKNLTMDTEFRHCVTQYTPILWQREPNCHGVALPVFSSKGTGFIKLSYFGEREAFLTLYNEKHVELTGMLQIIYQVACQQHFDAIFAQPSLTTRSRECLQLLAKGLTNIEISRLMGVSKDRVKELVGQILQKLQAANRTEAVMIAASHHLL